MGKNVPVLIFLLFSMFSVIIASRNGYFYLGENETLAPSLARSFDTCQGVAGEGREFRCVNRRALRKCSKRGPYINISLSTEGPLADEENVTVTVSGMLDPSSHDWVGLISPVTADISNCPLNIIRYIETGDLKSHPLLCHYPLKAQFLKNDPSYKSCAKSICEKKYGDKCSVKTCSGSVTFDVVNIRTDIEFVLFGGGFLHPCILKRSQRLKFAEPSKPLYPRLSVADSTSTAMKVSWISADKRTQYVRYGGFQQAESSVSTFTPADMCDWKLGSAAKDFGWHDPGYMHTALMTPLLPLQTYFYTLGSDTVGWSQTVKFQTPPPGGFPELRFIAFGDMGHASPDPSNEHYLMPGSLGVINAITKEVAEGNIDFVLHIGDISYATGFLVEWDHFLHMITPVASHVSYMTAIGNHESDFPNSTSHYHTPDSGGECGVPYEKYFSMPTSGKDRPWYSINQGPIHFTIISTEHKWTQESEQYEWIKKDLASIDRKLTPWLIFCGHRPMYSTGDGGLSEFIRPTIDPDFVLVVEPLLLEFQVDLVFWGHVHNYERSCSVFNETCKALPSKDQGIDTFNNTKYNAPIHIIMGTGGFTLDNFKNTSVSWSMVRKSEHGYARIHAMQHQLLFEFISSQDQQVEDSFKIIK